MIIGFNKLKIIAINPSEEELLERFPDYEEESFNYSYIEEDKANIYFYLQDNIGNIYQHIIKLENKEHITKSNYYFYINQVADYQIVKEESQLFESFKTFQKGKDWNDITKRYNSYEIFGNKLYTIAIKGEIELLNMLKCIEPHNIYSEETDFFLNNKKIFEGDFSEIRKRFMTYSNFHLTALFYIENGIQKIHKWFMPFNFYRDVANNMEISNVFKKMYKEFNNSLTYLNKDSFYLLQKSIPFKESMLPKKRILVDTEPDY